MKFPFRHMRRGLAALCCATGVLLAAGSASAQTCLADFAGSAPGWTGTGNTSNGSNFAYSATNNAGGAASGEIGGTFDRASTQGTRPYFTYPLTATTTRTTRLFAKGRINAVGDSAAEAYIAFVEDGQTDFANVVGLHFNDQAGNQFRVALEFRSSDNILYRGTYTFLSSLTGHDFEFEFDPTTRTLSGTISGQAMDPVTLPADKDFAVDSFGLSMPPNMPNTGSIDVFADDLAVETGDAGQCAFDNTILTVRSADDSGHYTLREAIAEANSLVGANRIAFDILGFGEIVLQPGSPFSVTDNDLTIDGTTQFGTTCGNVWSGSSPSVAIRLDGTAASQTSGGNYDGFDVSSDNVTIRGLSLTSFDRAVDVASTASGTTIECMVMGVRALGAQDANIHDVYVSGPNTTIGGANSGDGNLMSGSAANAVYAVSTATGLVIQGNAIGLNATNTGTINSANDAIHLVGTSNVTIGGESGSSGNIIAGSNDNGIETRNASSVSILGNMIGVDHTGNTVRENVDDGIFIVDTTGLTIGDGTDSGNNIISGNGRRAIEFEGTLNTITINGNYIGTDQSGNNTLTNGQNTSLDVADGIAFGNGANVTTVDILDNVIGGFPGAQIEFFGAAASGVTIQGNSVGVGADGISNIGTGSTEPLINISGGTRNYSNFTIGGVGAGEGNIVANGGSAGIWYLSDIAGTPNIIAGNTIRDNAFDGVILTGNSSKVAVFQNSIYDNGGEAFDIGNDGITPNDANDGDGGSNDQLNFPVINIIGANGTTSVNYDITLDTVSHGEGYRVDFYRDNSSGDTNGEGEDWLGHVDLTYTGAIEDFSGTFTANSIVNIGDVISANTTRKTSGGSFDQSSEYAQNSTAVAGTSPLIVTNTNDSGLGSLRNAIDYANANTGEDNITFDIPGAGPHTINLVTNLPDITDADISIDGTTQSGAVCGDVRVGTPHTLKIQIPRTFLVGAANTSLRGLSVTGNFELIRFDNGSDGSSLTCSYVGLDPSGTAPGTSSYGILISGPNNVTIGGTTAGDGNVLSGNPNGGLWSLSNDGTTIAGNVIGMSPDQTATRPNGDGLRIHGGTNMVIGGSVAARNIIAGNSGDGIELSADSGDLGADISYNLIGETDAGTLAGNGSRGVYIWTNYGANGLSIHNNTIRGSGDDGIQHTSTAHLTSIYSNSIYGNGGLGIDLSSDGVATNDSGDADAGPNDLLNFPLLNTISADGSTTVSFDLTLDTETNPNGYRIEFFKNSAADASGHGEGETYLGFFDTGSYTAGSSLNFTGSFTASESVSVGNIISATATRKTGATTYDATSEFAANATAAPAISPLIVTNTNDSGTGSLRAAIDFANANATEDNITFDIPGGGPHRITLSSNLTISDDGITIDGATQSGATCGTLVAGSPHNLQITVDGGHSIQRLFEVNANNFTLRGLAMVRSTQNLVRQVGNESGFTLECNYFGVEADGTTTYFSSQANLFTPAVRLENGSNATVHNNVIVANTEDGDDIGIRLDSWDGATITGNFVGLLPDGSTVAGNSDHGISLDVSTSNIVIGGTATSQGNVISGNGGPGIWIGGNTNTVDILGNKIGTDYTGAQDRGNAGSGIFVQSGQNDINVGDGTDAGSNLIRFNGEDGVDVINSNTRVAIRRNSIFDNTNYAIGLNNDGRDINDANDVDTGANLKQNYPVINAISTNGGTEVSYDFDLDAEASASNYTVDFYRNAAADTVGGSPVDYGETQVWLGEVVVTHNSTGSINYTGSFTAAETVSVGDRIVATATLGTSHTSEVSDTSLAQNPLIVTNTNDSGAGSLRSAIEYANANVAEDAITFDIPGTGPHTIQLSSALPQITDDGISIDGETQSGATCGTLVSGTPHDLRIKLKGFGGDGQHALYLFDGANQVIRGLSIGGFGGASILSNGNVSDLLIECNYISVDPDGTTPDPNTTGAGVEDDILIQNTANATVRNNLLAGNTEAGADAIQITSNGGRIEGNLIGTDETGNTAMGYTHIGIVAVNTTNTVIGGTTPAQGNVFGGSPYGIRVTGAGVNNVSVIGNRFGVGVDGASSIGGTTGVQVDTNAGSVLIGDGTGAGANQFRSLAGDGVVMLSDADAAILANRFSGNGNLAIDIDGDGVTPNDPSDADTGPNGLQNHPVINSVTADGGAALSYDIDLDAQTNTEGYRIEFFRNSSADASGHGEGETYLGSFDTGAYTAGSSLNFSGSLATLEAVSVGDVISATATRKTGASSWAATSEFAANATAASPLIVTNTNDSGAGSLRAAIEYANANTAEDAITFNIPGAGPHTITLSTQIPTIADGGVSIDGSTQSGASCGQLTTGTPHDLRIQILGNPVSNFAGLVVNADGVTVRGLSIGNFGNTGITSATGANNTLIECNYVSVAPDGVTATPNAVDDTITSAVFVNTADGIVVRNNLISGNNGDPNDRGLVLSGHNNATVTGNIIGLTADGTAALPNATEGLVIIDATTGTIGGGSAISRNIISGNGRIGIGFLGATSGPVSIAGNYVGVGRDGATDLGNGTNGIYLTTSDNVTIGGSGPGEGNVISGNGDSGLYALDSDSLRILGNVVGLDSTGATPVPNAGRGIQTQNGDTIIIGDGSAGGRNVVAGNDLRQIYLTGTFSNASVNGNYIGTDATGSSAVANGGGLAAGADDALRFADGTHIDVLGNVIGGVRGEYVEFWGASTSSGITIRGNNLGVGADGTSDIATNGASQAVILFGNGYTASDVVIGGLGAAESNLIANYSGRGIRVADGAGPVTGVILGNTIRDNGSHGIEIGDANATIAIYANSIYGNGSLGIDLGTDDAVTANDANDSDTGPNALLNYPILNTISADGSTTVSFDFDLDTETNANGYRIEFFKNSAGDPSGHGEGETYLGSFDTGAYTAGSSLNFTGSFTATEAVSVGNIISATATRKTGASSYDATSEFAQNSTAASPLVVTNANDSGAGSLRAAIDYANANAAEDAITFALSTSDPNYDGTYWTISPLTDLPLLDDAGISIDATTQAGATCGDLWNGVPPTLKVRIDADGSQVEGLYLRAAGITVKGLSITGFTRAIRTNGNGDDAVVQCNFIGLAPDGTPDGNVSVGIWNNADAFQLGGLNAGEGNVISGNGQGVALVNGSTATSIQGNFIGTDPTGTSAASNAHAIYQTSGTITISDITRNLLSGNTGDGFQISGNDTLSGSAGDLVIKGNYIGVDRLGTSALGNNYGIRIWPVSLSGVTIGGVSASDRNIVSGNNTGIDVRVVSNVSVLGNYIGVGSDGSTPLGNSGVAIRYTTITNGTIGNGLSGGRNIISDNGNVAIAVSDSSSSIDILGNYIGTDAAGTTGIGTASNAISITNSSDISVGNGSVLGRNVIASAGGAGLYMFELSNATIDDNYFGVLANGETPAPLTTNKAIIFNADPSTAGFTNTIVRNNVLANTTSGALDISSYSISAAGASSQITVQGNKIGVTASGSPASIDGYGIKNTHVPGAILIGGDGPGEGNVIANTTRAGIIIQSFAKTTSVIGNSIYDNGGLGIELRSAAEDAYDNNEPDIVTPNDAGDGDAGANDLLNFPVINSFGPGALSTEAAYDFDLDVPANGSGYRVEFFKNSSADPTGYGEGEIYLGAVDISSHSGGSQTFSGTFTASTTVAQNDIITATATRKTGPSSYANTSEFSLAYTSNASTELVAEKSVAVFDPSSAGLYALPGNDIISSITVTNPGLGSADTDSIVLIDAVPPEMTFYNGDMDDGGPATAAVYFEESGSTSLSFNAATDARYSNSVTRPTDMSGCTYTPSAGYDDNVTYVCFNPKGAMAAGDPDPSFTLSFRARIK